MEKKTYISIAFSLLLVIWFVAHTAGIFWGTQNVPMHQTYVADEQRPVNGALHMLKEKSLFGLRGKEEFFYGPIFAVLSVPAIVADFSKQVIFDGVRTSQDYMNSIIFDWGGIVLGLHITVVLAGVLSLYVAYKMFLLKTLNPAFGPNRRMLFAGFATMFLGTNYFFFENSTIYMNWIFVAFFLIGQLYLGLLIYETKGKRPLCWWLHGLVTLLNFGINYLNIIYLVAYIPLAFILWRKNEENVRRYLYTYLALLTLGILAIIVWNPFTFIRLLGLLGIGSMAKEMAVEYQTTFAPFQSSTTSFGYYTTVLVANYLSLFIVLIITARSVLIKRFKENFMWMWMFGSVAILHFIVFGALAHHEERYVLITTVTLLLFTGTITIKYLTLPARNKIALLAVVILTAWYGIYHVVHIGKWIDIYADGPAEKAMIAEVLALQKEGESIAIVQDHIAGHVHTKEAYQVFMEQKNATDVNLYKAIMSAPLPSDIVPLTAEYVMPWDYEKDPSIIEQYDHVIRYQTVCSLEINQATYIATNLTSLWYWDLCKPKYIQLK